MSIINVRKKPSVKSINYILFACGIIYSFSLLSYVHKDTFFSIDSGLKYLMVKQYSEGVFSTELKPTHEEWVEEMWNDGYYPFGKPFVYNVNKKKIVGFPVLFQLLSTPFYFLFNQWGLFIIPMLSLWILWYRFIKLCEFFNFKSYVITLSLGAFIFSTPLTIYGAAFWEHTLAVLLIFAGIEFYLKSAQENISSFKTVIYSFLTGFSVWLRPESSIVIIILFIFLIFFENKNKSIYLFLILTSLIVFLFVSTNFIFYGHPFGIHSLQVLARMNFNSLIPGSIQRFISMQWLLLKTFPLMILFLLIMPVLIFFTKKKDFKLISLLSLGFFLSSPIISPNDGGGQWGPRYLLIIIPVIIVIIAYYLDSVKPNKKIFKHIAFGLFFVLFFQGAIVNLNGFKEHLIIVYSLRAKHILNYIEKSDIKNVLMSENGNMSLDLAAAFEKKNFFYSKTIKKANHLLEVFLKKKVNRFFLITPKEYFDLPQKINLGDRKSVNLTYYKINLISIYRLFIVSITHSSANSV